MKVIEVFKVTFRKFYYVMLVLDYISAYIEIKQSFRFVKDYICNEDNCHLIWRWCWVLISFAGKQKWVSGQDITRFNSISWWVEICCSLGGVWFALPDLSCKIDNFKAKFIIKSRNDKPSYSIKRLGLVLKTAW